MLETDLDRETLRRVLIAALPGLFAAACGTASTGFDAGPSEAGAPDVACGGCFCDGSSSTTYYATTYTPCPSDDAGADAEADASADGGAGEAGACFAACQYACTATAPSGMTSTCVSELEDDGGATRTAQCRADEYTCTGRRTDGLIEPIAASTLGETLAKLAWLEAASVHSFRRLARELRAHGAPRSLVRSARDAARDEIRHARVMRSLARRHGALVAPVRAARTVTRDLETIARENAVEGCVVEALGALFAAWQAERAEDEMIRAAMRVIAPDELRHASLAWAVAAWIEPRLDPSARSRVRSARARTAAECVQNAAMGNAAIAGPLGLPSASAARALARALPG